MSLDLDAVRYWQGEPLDAGARKLIDVDDRIQSAISTLLATGPDRVGWRGEAGAAAAGHHGDLLRRVARLVSVVSDVQAALAMAAGRAQSASDLAREALALAELHGAVITGSGLVLDAAAPRGGGVASGLPDLQVLVQRAIAEAGRADADLAAVLLAVDDRFAVPAHPVTLSALTDWSGDGSPGATDVVTPTTSGSAATLAWWAGLSSEARRDAILTSPDLVGGTDGIPAWARDRANRSRLLQAERDLTTEAVRLRPPSGGGVLDQAGGLAGAATVGTLDGPSRRSAYLQAQAKLASVRQIEQVLAQPGPASAERELIVLDVTGRSVKAAVAVGDVDRAGHLAVVVPGFTTTVQGDLMAADAVAADLRDVARRESMAWGDRGDVAVISWLGYDAPQIADSLREHSVVLRASAEAGAAALGPFLRGLPAEAHLTVVAHSYGSTTAGLAVAAGGTGVDDLVAIGSPGLGVASTQQLGIVPSRVHVIEARGDPVADLGWFGRDPGHLAGVDLPSADAAPLPDGSVGLSSTGHSQYLRPGTTSQWNVAAVIVGTPAVPSVRSRQVKAG